MTIFRFRGANSGLILMVLCGLCGCVNTTPVAEIIAGNLQNEELLDAFGDRLDFLSKDEGVMTKEMLASGFELKDQSGECGSWQLPEESKRVWAFVQFCKNGNGSVDYGRFGISREAMTYD